MKKTPLMILILSMFLSLSLEAKDKNQTISPALKKKVQKAFLEFHRENQKLREKHQNELYEDQQKILKRNHEKTLAFFRDISKLQQTVSFGDKKENKKIQLEIDRRKKLFRGKMDDERRKARKTMMNKRDKFQKNMEKRRKAFKNKMKSFKEKS